ncbi:hypothetical protein TcBrA4_0136180 [Trypanosoma cruzi]|nr:hypothetical protein TcBrA4_0136180 [Trypanosoma cruzi]
MGYKAVPEILQIIITSAIAVVTTVVRRLWAAPPLVRVGVWIGNMRIAGSKSEVTLWEAQLLRNADGRRATMGEDRESGATQCTFLWVQFDHTHRAVSPSDKFVRFVCAMPSLNSSTIAEWRLWRRAFSMRLPFCARIYITTRFSERQCDDNCPHFTRDCAGDIPGEPSAVSGWFGREIATHHREYNRKRNNKPTEKASAAIAREVLLHGW